MTVSGADGQPFVGFDRRGAPQQQWTLRDGRATVEGLPPGTWNVTVKTAGGSSRSGIVTTSAAGGEAELVIE